MKSKLALAVASALVCASGYASQSVSTTNLVVDQASPEILATKSYSVAAKTATSQFSADHDFYIVELSDAPLAHYEGGVSGYAATSIMVTGDKKLDVRTKQSQSYTAYLNSKQAEFVSAMSTALPGATVRNTFSTLFNGVVVYAEKSKAESLNNLPGVKAVFPQRMFHAQMDASHDVIGTPEVWESLGGNGEAGKGVKVAIIDSGIRPENPMFSGEGFDAPTDLPEELDDYCSTTDEAFCNNKLIVARYSAPTFATAPGEYTESPLGFNGHGTHVAGTAVGNQVDVNYNGVDVTLAGVAPGAYLMVYKGLFATAGNIFSSSGSNIMLMEALEHATNDGADVINNSWGGGAGMDPALSPYQAAFEAAEAAGIVVVSAAGNDGNGAQTIGCPSCIESGLSVANTTHGRFFANSLTVDGTAYMAISGNNDMLGEENVSLPLMAALNFDPENFEGCAPFAEGVDLTGHVALISRGSCAFTDKAANAEAAGAEAIVVYNNLPSQPFTMAIESDLPALMVSQADGLAIIDGLGESAPVAEIDVNISRTIVSQYIDNMNGSSSRGPNGDANILKPDIGAPGSSILSAVSPDDPGSLDMEYGLKSGTSMASPHVAGAAALLKQAYPSWSAIDIKTALTSTSTGGILNDDAESDTTPFDIGAGRLDLPAAMNAMVTFDKPSFADPACISNCSFVRTVNNMTDAEGTWTATVMIDNPGVEASVSPAEITLGANGSETASAELSLNVDTVFAGSEGWVFGQVYLTHSSGEVAHLPIALYAAESTDEDLLNTGTVDEMPYAGAPVNMRVNVTNKAFDEEITVVAKVPENATFIEGSESATVTDGVETSLTVNEAGTEVTWVGTLDSSAIAVQDGASFWGGPMRPLSSFGVAPINCTDGCDEVSFLVTVPFSHLGREYTQVTMSDNGFIAAGDVDTSGSWNHQNMPNVSAPNNVIAGLWSDYDLDDGTAGDTGGGQMYYGVLSGGGNRFHVFEWNDVQSWDDDSGNGVTFQIIILEGTDVIWINYGVQDHYPIYGASIGAEGINGVVGTSYHYNGGNPVPADGATLDVISIAGGSLAMDFQVQTEDQRNFVADDSAMTMEESAVVVDVLANDPGQGLMVAETTLMSGDSTHNAVKVVNVNANGGLDSASVSATEATNGTVSVNDDGTVTYTPNMDFFGTDSFTYTVADMMGLTSGAATVTVEVENINDAPVVAPTSPSVITEGDMVSMSANGSDVDGDELTYQWIQLAGPAVVVTASGESISFEAPDVPSDLDLLVTFQVVANDGEYDSNVGLAQVTVQNRSSSSSSMGLLILLAAPLAWIRRRKV